VAHNDVMQSGVMLGGVVLRTVMFQFNNEDKIYKFRADKNLLNSRDRIAEFATSNIAGLGPFELEFMDPKTGRFTATFDVIGEGKRLVNVLIIRKSGAGVVCMITGKAFDLRDGLRIGQYDLKIHEEAGAHLGTGLSIWDGSVLLAKYMECNSHLVKGKHVIEIGAGTGIAGMAAVLLNAAHVL
jgi:Lysine methyltransferase